MKDRYESLPSADGKQTFVIDQEKGGATCCVFVGDGHEEIAKNRVGQWNREEATRLAIAEDKKIVQRVAEEMGW